VSLVYDNELGTPQDKVFCTACGLDKVGRDNCEAVSVKYRYTYRKVAFQSLNGTAKYQLGLNMEFFGKFSLPLLSEMRRTKYRHPPNFTAVKKFAGYNCSLNGLSNANIVCDQEADRIKL
jgi:hypothetical protein